MTPPFPRKRLKKRPWIGKFVQVRFCTMNLQYIHTYSRLIFAQGKIWPPRQKILVMPLAPIPTFIKCNIKSQNFSHVHDIGFAVKVRGERVMARPVRIEWPDPSSVSNKKKEPERRFIFFIM